MGALERHARDGRRPLGNSSQALGTLTLGLVVVLRPKKVGIPQSIVVSARGGFHVAQACRLVEPRHQGDRGLGLALQRENFVARFEFC